MLLWASCRPTVSEPIRLTGNAQGTYYSISYYDHQMRDFTPQVDSLLHAFDLTASLWVDSSEICRFNDATDSLVVSDMFADLFQKSMAISRETDGCFDCRIAPLVKAYGFARTNRRDLSQSAIDSLVALCHSRVWLDTLPNGIIVIHKENAGAMLDFNAIAQGYSVDLLCEMFGRRGVEHYLVDVGGEVRGKGHKNDGTLWKVGIERPALSKNDSRIVEVAIPLSDESVVTSGSYRKYYEKNGVRFSHTINPFTGLPVAHTTLSTSVIDKEAWRADALATAFMVMGYKDAQDWIRRNPHVKEAFFIYDDNGEYRHYATPDFQKRIDSMQ